MFVRLGPTLICLAAIRSNVDHSPKHMYVLTLTIFYDEISLFPFNSNDISKIH